MARDYAALIANLLAHAEDEGNTEAARQVYRDKAEALMREYRIKEEDALATDPGSVLPIVKRITLMGVYSTLKSEYYPSIFRSLADHTECKIWVHWVNGEGLVAEVAGYQGDVRYLEFLWTAAQLMFSTRIDPTWSEERTEAENIYFLRNAGIERRAIADKAWGYGAGNEPKNRSKVQRIYLREVARRGEDARATGLGFNTEQYRHAYAREFITTLDTRLWKARQAANAAYGVVTLAGREDRVTEALWEAFPNLRPQPRTEGETFSVYVDPTTTCELCQKAKSGFCRGHNHLKPRSWTQADERRWNARNNSTSARAGAASGRSAAEGVHITRGAETPKTEAGTRPEIG